jgi:hypothetical protein
MRSLTPDWETALVNADRRVVLLVTVNVFGASPADDAQHMATRPGSICAATVPSHVPDAATGLIVPFWPTLTEWPAVEWRMDRRERRAEISEVQIKFSADSELGELLSRSSRTTPITARIDAWTEGMDLSQAIPLVGGTCSISSWPRTDGPVTLTMTDGDPDLSVKWPVDALTAQRFPEAPERVLGQPVSVVIGPAPDLLECLPIDRTDTGSHTRYLYLAMAAAGPSVVTVDGIVRTDWTSSQQKTVDGLSYVEIEFETEVFDDSEVLASGGVGITASDPVSYLCAWAGIDIQEATRAILRYEQTRPDVGLHLSVLGKIAAPVVELLRQRIVPQLPYALGFERGRLRLLPLESRGTAVALTSSTGLEYRLVSQPSEETAPVFNSFRFLCGRRSNNTHEFVVRRSAVDGPESTRALLAASQARYGVRPLPADVNAQDLVVERDESGNILGSPAAERLADLYAEQYSAVSQKIAYKTDWRTALTLERSDPVRVTDDYLTDASGYVERIALKANGPEMVLEVER